jgi:Iron-sulfur cluster-binding domain
MIDYWRSIGIQQFQAYNQNNRGGACDNGHYFMTSDKYTAEATQLLADGKASSLCFAAFHFAFIGWNGQYYICCSDYRKMDPLGSVHEYSIDEMDHIKLGALAAARITACAECSLDPVNAVREVLFEIEYGEKEQSDLDAAIKNRAGTHAWLPKDIDVLAWNTSLPKDILARQR